MSTYDHIEKYLRGQLQIYPAKSPSEEKVRTFIDSLFSDPHDMHSIRLAFCIAIDLNSGTLQNTDYLKLILLDECDVQRRGRKAIDLFDDALKEDPSRRVYSAYSNRTYNCSERIATVMEITTYMYCSGQYLNVPISWREDFIEKLLKAPDLYENITVTEWPNGNRKPYFWMTKYSALQEAINTASTETTLDVVNLLGLIPPYERLQDEDPVYVCCVYAPNFSEKNLTYQPNATNADWAFPLYLSYIQSDGWGRTFPTDGQHQRGDGFERIHGRLESLEISVRYLGKIKSLVQEDVRKILEHADKRFKLC